MPDMASANAGSPGKSQEWTGLTRGPKFSKGPKFYKGASYETAWNKDMLWQLYVRREAKSMGFKSIGSCDNASSGNPDLPPHMRKHAEGGQPKNIIADDTGSVVYKLGLSPRPKPLRGVAALRAKQEASALVPRAGPEALPPPWVAPAEPAEPPAEQRSLPGGRQDNASDYSNMSAALSRAVVEHRLKTAQEREERLEMILAKQRDRRIHAQSMLQRIAAGPTAPDHQLPSLTPRALPARAADGAPSASPVSPRGPSASPRVPVASPRPAKEGKEGPTVKSASHLKRGALSTAFQMA